MATVTDNQVESQHLKVTVELLHRSNSDCVCFTVWFVGQEDGQWYPREAHNVDVPCKSSELEGRIYALLGQSKTLAEEFLDPLMEVVTKLSDQEIENSGQSFFTE